MRPDTLLIHAGEPRPRDGGAVAMPIYQSSTFEETEARGYHDIRYARLSNTPSHEALHRKLAALEEAEAALATASGMAAISASLRSVLRAGDHVIAQEGLYGGTHDLMTRDLPRLGIAVTFVPGDDPAAWRAAATPRTRVFYVEALTNPLLRVGDLPAAAAFARERDIVSIIDNTFATPPQHARARELFAYLGAMLSFEPKGGAEAAERMFSRLTIPLHAPSLGGPETLVTRPAASSHVGLSPEERARIGISDALVRVSIGLEAPEDQIEDFDGALRG